MSWLSGGLSNITGQISNFTKEVLTEGTEEVSDHATELRVATSKVKELEGYALSQKIEIDRLKKLVIEHEERAESAELQLNHVSSEYRTQLQAKDLEINSLKQKYDEFAENQKKLLPSSSYAPTTVSESTHLYQQQQFEVGSDGMDFSDVIASQHEINRLSQEVQRLQAECNHWKQAHGQQSSNTEKLHSISLEDRSDVNEVQHLQQQIKQLQQNLIDEEENHQRELAALQDVQSQKMATMKKKQRNEVHALEDRIQELQLHLEREGQGDSSESDLAKVVQLQGQLRSSQQLVDALNEKVKSLEKEVENCQADVAEKARNIQRMGRQMEKLQQEKKKLNIERDDLLDKNTKVEKDFENMVQQEKQVRQQLGFLQAQVVDQKQHAQAAEELQVLRQEMVAMKKERDEMVEENQREMAGLRSALEESQKRLEEVQKERDQAQTCETLQDIHEAKERLEIDLLQRQTEIIHEKSDIIDAMIRTDDQKYKQERVVSALTADVNETRAAADQMMRDIGNEEHQRLTADLVNTVETENMVLKERVVQQEEKIQALEQCVQRVAAEKEVMEKTLQASTQSASSSLGVSHPFVANTSTPKPAKVASDTSGATPSIHMPPSMNDYDNDSIFSGHSELSMQNRQLDTHVKTLEGQIGNYEREIETFEMMKSDWQLEKEALEDVLLQLRKKLRQKEDSLNVVQATKGLVELERSQRKGKRHPPKIKEEQGLFDDDMERDLDTLAEDLEEDNFSDQGTGNIASDIDNLYHEVQLLTDSNAMLENERDLLRVEKEKLLSEMKELRMSNAELKTQSSTVPELATKLLEVTKHEVSALTDQLLEKDQELLNISLERDGMLSSLDELDRQHEQVTEQLLKTRDDLMKNNDNLSHQLALLEDQVEDYEKKLHELKVERDTVLRNHNEMLQERNQLKRANEDLGDDLELIMKKHNEIMSEKNELVSRLEGEVSDLVAESDRTVLENRQLKAELHKSSEENEVVRSLNEQVRQQTENSKQFEDEARRLRDEKESLSNEIMHLRDAAKESDQAHDDLQMKKNDLEITMSVLEEELADLRTKCEALEMQNHEFMQIHSDMTTRENIQKTGAESLNSTAIDFDKQLQDLRLELNSSYFNNSEHLARIEDLERSVGSLEDQLSNVSQDRDRFRSTLEDVEAKYHKDLRNIQEKSQHSIDDLMTTVDALRNEKVSLEKELSQSEQKVQEMTKRYESYIHEMTESRQMDTSSLQVEVERLMKISHEKEAKIFNLEMKCEQLDGDLEETKDMLQSSIDGQTPLKGLIAEREHELASLKQENSSLISDNEEKSIMLDDLRGQLQCLREVDNLLKSTRDENKKLRADLLDLRGQQDSDKLDAKTLDVITDLETEISTLNLKIDQKDEEIGRLHRLLTEHKNEMTETVDTQRKTVSESASKIRQLQTTVSNLENDLSNREADIDSLNKQLSEKTQLLELEKQKCANLQVNSGTNGVGDMIMRENVLLLGADSPDAVDGYDGFIPNGDIRSDHEKDLEEERKEMRLVLKDKDSVIEELQINNASLLRLLEDKAMSHGNNALLEIHKLQEQVKGQNGEKEQMMSVLSEKSRECSSLKSEVHRLMNVISAEKAALEKLQQDCNKLKIARDDPNEDMTKTAIKTLSQLVRDREMEIEALKQKNGTLLQVLQAGGSGAGGSEVHDLIQEKENLTKQLAIYQNDREQIINALNQKHQESLQYHGELQRLTDFVNKEMEKREKISQDFENLKQQYEDKQQSLLKTQNELVNYKQKYAELDESYRDVVGKEGVNMIETKYYDEKCADVLDLSEKMKQQDSVISQKERQISELIQKIESLEDLVKAKESDLNNLKMQLEKLNFELNELQIKLNDSKLEISTSQKRTSDQDSENSLLRESTNKLTMILQEKDFEINALKEKAQTLTRLMQERGTGGNKEEMERVLRESEATQHQAQLFRQERDQMVLAMKQQQDENVGLQSQYQALSDREQKLTRELDRLREHLIQIEEGYTLEALEAESREKELRNRLALAEDKAASSSSAVESVNQQAHVQFETLQQQLRGALEQRDQALYQIGEYQKQTNQYAMSLQNLQMVLEQFQYEKEAQLQSEAEKYKREVSEHQQKYANLERLAADLESKLSEANEGLEAASRLSEQLDRKEEIILALKEEVHLREETAKKAEKEIELLTSSSQEKVDKLIVKNLFLGYFSAPKNKQTEVIKLIGGVLNFNKEEMAKAGIDGSGGWLTGWLRRTPQHSTPTHQTPDKSFSQLFVKFLENESTPKQKMTLPAEEMAMEQQGKHPHHQRPAFNPFSAQRHATMPLQLGDMPNKESHILMNPSSPVLPMFPPLVTSETPPISASGHSSATNSGRSTPSGNILRDVLNR
ncbi:thyroid receptor-interacting protein 11-like isoform X2 [Lineus longissimus]|uniref:thyroid receptor-interacting protein 11-like isoform X2 n=1 Tax=Lineus longissimus TaxID=88925 RepID=UPI002B4F08C7